MNDDIHALSGAYVLDALDAEERHRFEDHLEVCSACRLETSELASVLDALAIDAAEAPPAALKADVLAAIDMVRPLPPIVAGTATDEADDAPVGPSTPPLGPNPTGTATDDDPDVPVPPPTPISVGGRRRRIARGWLLAAAAAILALVGGAAAFAPWRTASTTPTAASVLDAPDARSFTKDLGSFSATVVVSRKEDRAVIVSADMPSAPSGHSYQLWYQRPGEGMQPAGLMPASDGGQKVLLDGPLDDATAVGVTVEPAGGSPQPTTEPVAVFALQ
jgi:anti-sigma-K factor RskA